MTHPHGVHIHARSPGRVNLLGEHVDYNGGPVVPAAIDRCLSVDAHLDGSRLVRLIARDLEAETCFSLDALDNKLDCDGRPLPGWALYPAGVAWSLQRQGLTLSGMQAEFSSDIPIGAGLSSSAALEAAFAVVWQAAGGWQVTRMQLAQLCLQGEREYVGLSCGILDQFAVLHGQQGQALYLDTRSLDWHSVPLPPHTAIIIADSRVRRSLTNSAYNQRRDECRQALAILQTHFPSLTSLGELQPDDLYASASLLPETLLMRARHVVEECERTRSAVQVLEAGNPRAFGALMLEGHASLRDLYEVSTPELDLLVDVASSLPGCYGSRLTGAGFGGCTVSLVHSTGVDPFIHEMEHQYKQATGLEPFIYCCHAVDGASAEVLL